MHLYFFDIFQALYTKVRWTVSQRPYTMRDFLHCIKGFFHVGYGWLLGHWRFGFHLKKLGVPSVPSLGKLEYTLNINLCFLQYLLRNNVLHRWMQFSFLTVKRSIFSCLYHYISCGWHCHQQSTMHPEINVGPSHIETI